MTTAKIAIASDDVIFVSAAVVHTAWRRSRERCQRCDDDDDDDEEEEERQPVDAGNEQPVATAAAASDRDMQCNQYRRYRPNSV